MKYGTAASFGLNVNKQIDIALRTMYYNGGSAKMKDIIANVQKEIYPNRLCSQGKRTLSYCVSRQAVERGLVHKHDPLKRSQWFITEQGINKLVNGKNKQVVVNESNKNKATVKKKKTIKKETPQVKIIEREVVKPEKIVIENKQDNKLIIGSLIVTNLVVMMIVLTSLL